jgi:mannose-6-phosphate isomerase-like protein (cupin superfamily)
MTVVDIAKIEGRAYPAGRRTRNLIGGASPLSAEGFCMGHVTLDPDGGQVPWHNHGQEEVYFILQGTGEACVGEERIVVKGGQAMRVPPNVFHQLTNIGTEPLLMIYVYSPAGDVAHWRQELDGTLPRAGADAPGLPAGARQQYAASSRPASKGGAK